jgi:uncharacterized protein
MARTPPQAARPYLGSGWSFPVRVTSGGTLATSSEEARVKEAIWVVLATGQGERQMRPAFGCGIHELVFSPNNPRTRAEVAARVREALSRYLPRIEVADVRVDADEGAPNRLLIRVDYRLPQHNSFGNVVYPFYLQEGGAPVG